jgi:glyoxylase-like metal-dependent hydrolase (beta-lactamase superfamily II)
MAGPVELKPGLHRLGSDKVNFFLIEEESRVTMVDAGVPGYRDQLEPALASMGRSRDDLAAIVLTHAHNDHIGFAPEVHERGVPVYVHPADHEFLATGKQPKRERGMVGYLRHPTAWTLLAHLAAKGGARVGKITDPVAMHPGAPLDIPGRPVAVHAPGHTRGHCTLHFEALRSVFTGDLLCTWNPLTGRQGPQLMPGAFNESSDACMRSLAAIEGLDVDLVLPGHGHPWTEGAAAAVARAREAGPS